MIGKLLAVVVVLMFAGGLATTIKPVYAQDAYSVGFKDGLCDANQCHGHGFDPSCPSGHSASYCSNYHAGYNAGWNQGNGNGNNDNSDGQAGANSANVRGSNNVVNQQIINTQRHNSDNNPDFSNNDNNDNNDGSGQLPSCKQFCLGVQ